MSLLQNLVKNGLSNSSVRNRSFHTTSSVGIGEQYKRMWYMATGGENFGKKAKKIRMVKIKNFLGVNFGKKNVKWTGLNDLSLNPNLDMKQFSQYSKPPAKRKHSFELSNVLTRSILEHNAGGYTRNQMAGIRAGPVQTQKDDDELRDFDSCVIGIKRIRIEYKKQLRAHFRTVVCVGNGAGTIGFGEHTSMALVDSIRMAKYFAAKSLITIPLYDRHTIYHPLRIKYNNIVLEMDPKPMGYGIIAQRSIKKILELAGIQNIYVKINGGFSHPVILTKCVFKALASQETTQELTERTGQYITQYSPFGLSPPKVIAMPSSSAISEYEKRKHDEFDIKLPELVSHYRGLHKPKRLNLFKPTHCRRYVPSELARVKKILKEGV